MMRLGDYLLIERLNQGGMADVYLAKTFGFRGADQILAVKCIRPELCQDQEFVRMFVDEARLAVQLDHVNVAQTYELGRIGSSYFMAMEYVWGRDLRQILDRVRARGLDLPEHLVLHLMMQICEGLEYAHRKVDRKGLPLSIVHRDVSPQNVLVSYAGEVKLIDFGIAKAASHLSQSQAGVLKGKYGYMSPEQVRGLPVDHRSDQFAAGVVFWEAMTRERLFVGSSDFSILEKVQHAEVIPPRLVAPHMSPEIEEIILRALALDPGDRFGTMSDMREAIVALLLRRHGHPNVRELGGLVRDMFGAEERTEQELLDKARSIMAMPADVSVLLGSAPADDPVVPPRAVTDRSSASVPADRDPAINRNPAITGVSRQLGHESSWARRDTAPPGDDREPTALTGKNFRPEVTTRIHGLVWGRWRYRDVLLLVVAMLTSASLVLGTWWVTRGGASASLGSLVVVSIPPQALISIDGTPAGTTPFSSNVMAPGRHRVVLQKPGWRPVTRRVRINKGMVVELKVALTPAPSEDDAAR